MLDDVDLHILELLQDNARMSNAESARTVGLTPPAALERIRKLEKKGVLLGFHARLEPAKLNRGMLAFVFLRTNESLDDQATADAISHLPNVQELRSLVDYDYFGPALTPSHPFLHVQSSLYWSSTTVASAPNQARFVFISIGPSVWDHKSVKIGVWPVRDERMAGPGPGLGRNSAAVAVGVS